VIIIIDGYNVLKQVYDGELISDQQRGSFIRKLAIYQRKRRHKKIKVIFDGGSSSWPIQERVRGISVVYSGFRLSADDYIHSFMKEHRENAENMLLVSSDRQVCLWAAENGVASIDADEFYMLMIQAINPSAKKISKGQKALKITEDFNPELDELMQEASRGVKPKAVDLIENRPDPTMRHKLSKEDRALLKKIKKL